MTSEAVTVCWSASLIRYSKTTRTTNPPKLKLICRCDPHNKF